MFRLFVLSFFLLTNPIHSADKNVGDYANHCSALFLLMTMLPDDDQWKPFVDNMQNLSQTMNLIAQSIYSEINLDSGYRSIIDARNIEADNIKASYYRKKSSVLNQYARCDKFREDFAYTAMQYQGNEIELLNALRVPPVSVEMTRQKTELIRMVFDLSFKNMEASGIDSIVELYERLRNP